MNSNINRYYPQGIVAVSESAKETLELTKEAMYKEHGSYHTFFVSPGARMVQIGLIYTILVGTKVLECTIVLI